MRRPSLFMVAALLFLYGLVVGTLRDEAPTRLSTFRGGYRVLEVDLRTHTRFSDGFLSPFDLVLHGRRRGLDALAITDRGIVFPAQLGAWFARRIGGPTVLVGEELSSSEHELYAVGLGRRVDGRRPLREVIADVHAQGGVVIAGRPVRHSWPTLVPLRASLDGSEVMHPVAYGTRAGADGWRWEDMRDYFEEGRAEGQHLTAVAASDYHFFSPLGVCRTLVFARGDDGASILEALRAGRTVVYDPAGRAHGDPAMIEVLAREPYVARPQDDDYRGNGGRDRVARVLGLVGLLGIVLFRPPRREAEPIPQRLSDA